MIGARSEYWRQLEKGLRLRAGADLLFESLKTEKGKYVTLALWVVVAAIHVALVEGPLGTEPAGAGEDTLHVRGGEGRKPTFAGGLALRAGCRFGTTAQALVRYRP